MKRTLFIILLAVIMISAAKGQILLPNGDLESWRQVQGTDSMYWEPAGGFFATLDSLATLQATGPLTAYRTTDAHSGSYAIKLVSKTYTAPNVFIPGLLGTTLLLLFQNSIAIGKPCYYACDPKHFTGWFKYFPVNNDSCKFAILVSHANTLTHRKDTIYYGDTIIKGTVPTYTQFDIPVKAHNTSLTPDSITILAVASADFNLNSLQGGHGGEGSTLFVDDLSVVYPAGIQQNLMSEVEVNTYPDPASDVLTIELSKKITNGILKVYNLQGKLMDELSLSDIKTVYSVSHLVSGTYYYKLTNGPDVVNTGSFVIKR